MSKVYLEKLTHHKGWMKLGRDIESRKFISPEGEVISFLNIRGKLQEFCKKYNLRYESVTDLWVGRTKSYKGWKKFEEILSENENSQYNIENSKLTIN